MKPVMGIANSHPVQLRSVETPADVVVPVDLIAVLPGERIPVVGTLTAGGSQIGKSMLSVEPIPVGKRPGDEVVGGTVNQPGGFRCRATRAEADTVLPRNIRLVKDAQAGKPPPLRYGAGGELDGPHRHLGMPTVLS